MTHLTVGCLNVKERCSTQCKEVVGMLPTKEDIIIVVTLLGAAMAIGAIYIATWAFIIFD